MNQQRPISSFTDSNYSPNAKTQPTTKRNVDGSSGEFYPTPSWATRALLTYETFQGNIWECACGDGAMTGVFIEQGHNVISSDLYDRGFGEIGHDFTISDRLADNIVTNPPYNLAGDFVLKGLELTSKKLCLLLRLAFLEGVERNQKIFSITPPSRVWAFSERITFYPKGAERKGSGTTAYAWFVWDKDSEPGTKLGWIEPGHKRR